jgi:hypothetical protein
MTANNQDFTLACDAPTNPVPVMDVALLGSVVRPLQAGTIIEYCGHEAEVTRDEGGERIDVKCEGTAQCWYWSFEGVECSVVSVPNVKSEPRPCNLPQTSTLTKNQHVTGVGSSAVVRPLFMSLIDLLNRTQATRAEIMELLRGTEELRQKLERENHALREAGGLMRAWIGNNEKTITERWDSVLPNVKVIRDRA